MTVLSQYTDDLALSVQVDDSPHLDRFPRSPTLASMDRGHLLRAPSSGSRALQGEVGAEKHALSVARRALRIWPSRPATTPPNHCHSCPWSQNLSMVPVDDLGAFRRRNP